MLEHGECRINLSGNVNTELFLRNQTNNTTHLPICVANKETGSVDRNYGGLWEVFTIVM